MMSYIDSSISTKAIKTCSMDLLISQTTTLAPPSLLRASLPTYKIQGTIGKEYSSYNYLVFNTTILLVLFNSIGVIQDYWYY